MIYLGADHAGFKLKEQIKKYLASKKIKYLASKKIEVRDLGNFKYEKLDDYPNYAFKVAKKVSQTKSQGILVCGSGVGVCIAANKVKGIRAAQIINIKMAKQSREHDNTNILCFGQNFINFPQAKKIIDVWLNTKQSKDLRHKRRLNIIKKMER